MGFALLPIFVAAFWIGMSVQAFDLSNSIPGAGVAGQMESIARVHAERAAIYAQACIKAALSSPGLISSNIAVAMPDGYVAPAGAMCMTTPNGSGRNIFAVLEDHPGASSHAYASSGYNMAWWRASRTGQAVNMTTGNVQAIPASIPPHSLVNWILVTP